jgi:hypothetical protein
MSAEKRFWGKVKKGSADDCWEWTGAKKRTGYGSFWVSSKKWMQAHKFSYILSGRTIKNGDFVMHTCDNPSCVNPFHLISGSPADNARDMVKKGRCNSGKWLRINPENCNLSKLNRDTVIEIRRLADNREMLQKEIAKKFGITRQCVTLIHNRKRWANI